MDRLQHYSKRNPYLPWRCISCGRHQSALDTITHQISVPFNPEFAHRQTLLRANRLLATAQLRGDFVNQHSGNKETHNFQFPLR